MYCVVPYWSEGLVVCVCGDVLYQFTLRISWSVSVFSFSVVAQQTGPIVVPSSLPTLSGEQLKALQMAKKYCQDVSSKFVSERLRSSLSLL